MRAVWDAECVLAPHKGWNRLPNNTWVKRTEDGTTHYNGGPLWQREITEPVCRVAGRA